MRQAKLAHDEKVASMPNAVRDEVCGASLIQCHHVFCGSLSSRVEHVAERCCQRRNKQLRRTVFETLLLVKTSGPAAIRHVHRSIINRGL